MKTTFRGKVGVVSPSGYDSGKWDWEQFQLEDVVGTSVWEDVGGPRYFVHIKDFMEVEVTEITFLRILDMRLEAIDAT